MSQPYSYSSWPTEILTEYVVKAHHKALGEMLLEIKHQFAEILSEKHVTPGGLPKAHQLFIECAVKLEAHLAKEAIAILPFVKRYTSALKQHKAFRKPGVNSACPAINRMYEEHKADKARLDDLLCMMEEVLLRSNHDLMLKALHKKIYEFKKRWQEQVALENNVLFPDIIALEVTLQDTQHP